MITVYNQGMRRIIRRILVIIPAVALEGVWIYALLTWIRPWAGIIEIVLSFLSVLFVFYLLTKHDEDTYKILWLLIILVSPLIGAVLYLLFGNKRTTWPLRRALRKNPLAKSVYAESVDVIKAIRDENPRLAGTFKYIEDISGLGTCFNGKVKYYPLGDDMFPDMLDAIKSAKHFILIEYFIIEEGVMWNTMVDLLSLKAEEGVTVKVLYDDFGSLTTYSGKEVKKLWERGIECVPFNPLIFIKGTLNYRDHRKMLVIDNRVVFSGGINLADEYINAKVKHGHWKDIGFSLEGRAVENYTRMFMQFWNAFAATPLKDDILIAYEKSENPDDGYVLSYYDSPLRGKAASNELFIELLSEAKDYAWFYTPYLILGDRLLDAFTRASARGVDVRIIMPGIPDKKIVYRISRSFYTVLLRAGVKIYEYTPGFVHAKASIVDDEICSIGTVNLDYRSLFLHFENNSLFYRSSILDDLKKDYLETQDKCRTVILGKSFKVSFFRWIVDGILRIIAPLC